MSATIAQIRAGLAANLGSIPDVQVSAYMLGSPTPPTIWLRPDQTIYDEAMQRGLDCVHITITAFVGLVADQGAQILLDTLLAPTGASSVKTAAESDKTLGGTVQDLRVTQHNGYQVFADPNIGRGTGHGQYLAADWTVEVYV